MSRDDTRYMAGFIGHLGPQRSGEAVLRVPFPWTTRRTRRSRRPRCSSSPVEPERSDRQRQLQRQLQQPVPEPARRHGQRGLYAGNEVSADAHRSPRLRPTRTPRRALCTANRQFIGRRNVEGGGRISGLRAHTVPCGRRPQGLARRRDGATTRYAAVLLRGLLQPEQPVHELLQHRQGVCW